MDTLIGIIAFIFVLGVIIVIHEGGHFMFARKFNILCREFAFGMGPILVKKKKGETLYSIRAFPIGGFCAIAGEEVEDDPLIGKDLVKLDIVNGVIKKIYIDTDKYVFDDVNTYVLKSYDLYDANDTHDLYMILEENGIEKKYPVDPQALYVIAKQEIQIAPHNRTLGAKRKRERALVIFGGPLMNFILAFVSFLIVGLIIGFASSEPVLTEVTDDTPAYQYGLQENDRILQLQSGLLSQDVQEWDDISTFMSKYANEKTGEKIIVKYERNKKTQETSINPQYSIYSLGLYSDYTKDGVFILEVSGKAEEAGLKAGQEIISIDGDDITSWYDVYEVFKDNTTGRTVEITVQENGQTSKYSVQPYSQKVIDSQQSLFGDKIPMAKISLGISPKTEFNFFKSFAYAGEMTYSSGALVFKTFDLLINSSEVGLKDLSGPVGIFSLSKSVATQAGFVGLLSLIGLLSVNVGLLNLLPIPALDGGRLVFIAYEAITKKKPNPKVETALIGVTMILLFGLMIYVFYNDILRLIGV